MALLAKIAKRDAASFQIPADAPDAQTPNLDLNLPPYLFERLRAAKSSSQTLAVALAENLLLAESLSNAPDETTRRLGLQTAFEAAMLGAKRLPDKTAGARLLEGFVLPHLQDAPDKATTEFPLTKQLILENACTTYRQSKDSEKLFQGVSALVFVADHGGDAEGADWARIKLAQDLAARGRFRDAINNLQAVTSPHLLGAKKWIPELEKQDKAQATKAQTAPPVATEPTE